MATSLALKGYFLYPCKKRAITRSFLCSYHKRIQSVVQELSRKAGRKTAQKTAALQEQAHHGYGNERKRKERGKGRPRRVRGRPEGCGGGWSARRKQTTRARPTGRYSGARSAWSVGRGTENAKKTPLHRSQPRDGLDAGGLKDAGGEKRTPASICYS